MMRWRSRAIVAIALAMPVVASSAAHAQQQQRPNIVIIWGDDIGQSNVSAYTNGLMGYRTPNIDSIAQQGVIFTDYYGEQSCTAGRSAFITGQSVFRTGLSKVGLPGADLGIRKEDPTIAELLKAQGYATGQFGKNHLGDKDEMLPTAHGFDEFYGNLYHLNAEEEPELPDYPKADDPEFPNFRKNFGPRGVIHSFANPDGTQRIEDTGPLTKKRMETIDDDIAARSAEFIEKQAKASKPMFVWVNFTHMHFRTHVKPESLGQSGRWMGPYADAMIDHDKNVGTVLAKLKELGIEDNTIVMYSTDNGPHMNSWPDAAMTPFRNEKNSNWEGAYRVPAMVRWPGKIKPGSVSNEIISHLDWMPTLLAAAGVPDVKEKLLTGYRAGNMTYKVHLDGYNLLPYLTGAGQEESAKGILLFLRRWRSDGLALRQLEARLRRAEGAGNAAGVVRAVHAPAGAVDLQPAARPVRALHHHVEHLLRLDVGPRVPAAPGASLRRQVPCDLQGLSSPPEGSELLHRSGAGESAARGTVGAEPLLWRFHHETVRRPRGPCRAAGSPRPRPGAAPQHHRDPRR